MVSKIKYLQLQKFVTGEDNFSKRVPSQDMNLRLISEIFAAVVFEKFALTLFKNRNQWPFSRFV